MFSDSKYPVKCTVAAPATDNLASLRSRNKSRAQHSILPSLRQATAYLLPPCSTKTLAAAPLGAEGSKHAWDKWSSSPSGVSTLAADPGRTLAPQNDIAR